MQTRFHLLSQEPRNGKSNLVFSFETRRINSCAKKVCVLFLPAELFFIRASWVVNK